MTAVLDRPAETLRRRTSPELEMPRPAAVGPSGGVPPAAAGFPARLPAPGRPRPARMAPPRSCVRVPPEAVTASVPVLRLTRRARLLCTVSVLAGALLVTGVAAANSDGAGPAGAPTGTVVVGPGDTLWRLAAEIAPGADTAAVVRELQERNGLDATPLQPGQVLSFPTG